MKKLKDKGFGTKSIHAGTEKNVHGTLATPIYQTSTFVFDSAEQGGKRFALEEGGYIYTRLGSPTQTALEEKMAVLEGGESCMAMSSGIGAISSTFWTHLSAGDHLLCDETLYGCTYSLIAHGLTRFGVKVTFTDFSKIENVKKHMTAKTKMVFFETPVNPNLKLIDITSVVKEVKNINKDTLVIVDNTFATPMVQRPLNMGVDIVLHSATKYLNGHGDVIAGFAIGKKELIMPIRLIGVKDMTGSVISPFDAYLIIRGLKTLEVRMIRHQENAMKIAEFLEGHPNIEKVYYPGLKNNEFHDLAKKQMNGFGGIIAFELKGGLDAGKKLCNSLDIITLAVSLGDTESLIQHPASMTHSPYTPAEQLEAGITPGLVRMSVGLENVDDIIKDLENGLSK